MRQGAYTLIEMVIVVIIIATLCTIAWPNYTKARRKAEDKEAFSMLYILRAAEKNYKQEVVAGVDSYYPASGNETDIDQINSNLNTHLPKADLRHWDYRVYSTGCVEVARRNDDGRKWTLEVSSNGLPLNSTACSE